MEGNDEHGQTLGKWEVRADGYLHQVQLYIGFPSASFDIELYSHVFLVLDNILLIPAHPNTHTHIHHRFQEPKLS